MRYSFIVAVALLVSALTGCATPSNPKAMATSITVDHKSTDTVAVNVSGGKATSSMGASQISDADFREALTQSINNSGLFRNVVDNKSGRYKLDAFIGMLSQPTFGLSFTVEMEVSYVLIDVQANKPVWKQTIKSSHTATTSDAFVGVERLRLANEGAARKNIEAAIRAMGQIKL